MNPFLKSDVLAAYDRVIAHAIARKQAAQEELDQGRDFPKAQELEHRVKFLAEDILRLKSERWAVSDVVGYTLVIPLKDYARLFIDDSE